MNARHLRFHNHHLQSVQPSFIAKQHLYHTCQTHTHHTYSSESPHAPRTIIYQCTTREISLSPSSTTTDDRQLQPDQIALIQQISRSLCDKYKDKQHGYRALNQKLERATHTLQSLQPSSTPILLSIENDLQPKFDVLDSLSPGLGWKFFLRYPEELIHPDAIELWSVLVGFLYTCGYPPDGISLILSKNPLILAKTVRDPGNLKSLFEWMKNEAGFNEKDIVKIIRRYPTILQTSVHTILAPRFQFLEHTIHLGKEKTVEAIRYHPELLSVDSLYIKERVDYINSYGLSHKELCYLFSAHPTTFVSSIEDTLQPVIDIFIDTFDCDDVLLRKLIAWSGLLTKKPETIYTRIEAWHSLFGLTPPRIKTILSRFPSFLSYPIQTEKYQKKIKFLIDVIKYERPEEAILKFPQYISYSLPLRIAPRCCAALALSSKSIQLVDLAKKEDVFLKVYGIGKEEYDAFVKQWAESEEAQYWLE